MATTDKSTRQTSRKAQLVCPVAAENNWVDLIGAGGLAAADNGGSTVLNPVAIIRALQGRLKVLGAGTTVQFRVRYTTGQTITACTIQPFGLDANNVPERLKDSTGTHPLSFLSDATNDAQDGTNSYTDSQEVDANGAAQVIAAVKVLATGTGAAAAVLQARVK